MDIQQLQLLAGRVRDLLQHSHRTIGHNQSLDLIASLAGLRNWPEVRAFPDRVTACVLDESSATRLAFRLKKSYGLDVSPSELLQTLTAAGAADGVQATHIWPSGPKPGVYVTTSQTAIDALLARYEQATDGSVAYAEEAGNHWSGSIDLGEKGLQSPGMNRVPSGTLIVLGPLELNQQEWRDSAERLAVACQHAPAARHRIAILVRSPAPEEIYEDLHFMARSVQPEKNNENALLGTVSEDGELQQRIPFARPRPQLVVSPGNATTEAIPVAALPLLREALTNRKSGLLLFGSSFNEQRAVDLAAASLALTEHVGPAARISPRGRWMSAKDWRVPDALEQLPLLPSIESAYDRGYRRMILRPGHMQTDRLLDYAHDVLFITGNYGSEAEYIFLRALHYAGIEYSTAAFQSIVALLGVTSIPTKDGSITVSDLFVPSADIPAMELQDALQFIDRERSLKWLEQVEPLLDSGEVSLKDVSNALMRFDIASLRDPQRKPAAQPMPRGRKGLSLLLRRRFQG